MTIHRVAIVGISGSGKSVFARNLAAKLGLPLIHMDTFFWEGKWSAVPEEEYLEKHAKAIEQDNWIIEGYIDEKMADRARRADLILYLDYPGYVCAWRVLMRWLQYRNESRPELPKEAVEPLNLQFLWKVLTRGERKDIKEALKHVDPPKVIRLQSPRELNSYLQKL
ncbi:MAG: hypothetical protein AAB649_01590 [Patescibacteria group bacterium]